MKKGRSPRRSIRSKLASLVFVSVGVSIALVMVVSAIKDSRREALAEIERMRSTARVIASLSGEAVDQRDGSRAFAAIRTISATPNIVYARLETPAGELLTETGSGARLSSDAALKDDEAIPLLGALTSRAVEISTPVVFARQEVGVLVVLGRTEGAARRILDSLVLSGLVAAAAVGVGLAMAWRMQRAIADPIVELTGIMGEVRGAHDYARTVDLDADDEIADLVEGFNAMLSEVRTRDEALAAHAQDLERTVEARTADLRAAREAADSANKAKSEFLATMSHEIRTPMNGVMVMAEMLAASNLAPRQRRFADIIANSGSSLLGIINDILDFSKIEAGKMDLEKVPVDVDEIVDDIASLFWSKARAKGLDFAVYVDPAVPHQVEADPVRLRQIISNLVNNAIKFTDAGGVLIKVAAPGGDRLRISVRDTGIGVPKDKLPRLFAAFSQADQSTTRKYGGTGLGLAICAKLVDAMGGRLRVDSDEGKGSVFAFEIPCPVIEPAGEWASFPDQRRVGLRIDAPITRLALQAYMQRAGLARDDQQPELTFTDRGEHEDGATVVRLFGMGEEPTQTAGEGAELSLPLRRADVRALLAAWSKGEPLRLAADERRPAGRAGTPQYVGARVLVADDSPVNREVAREALGRLGIDPAFAEDGREAVDAWERGGFDLILMDGSMPEMDGYEAAAMVRRLEAERGLGRTPIIALTAHVVGSAAEAWRESGMDGVLHKPFTLSALADALAPYLTRTGDADDGEPAQVAAAEARKDVEGLLDPQVTADLEAMAAAGRGDFVVRVKTLYKDNAPVAVQRIEEAARSADPAAVWRGAHALKSMSLNLGARAVAELAAKIEHDGRETGSIDQSSIQQLAGLLERTLSALVDGEQLARPAAAVPAADPDAALLAELAGAAERGEFSLVYQRQVGRDGVTLTGVESLLRWESPKLGTVSPAVFIPLAERHNRIRPITLWVLQKVMEDTAGIGVPVGFNASALEFADPNFVDDIAGLIRDRGFDPASLEIEITETAILKDGDEVRRNIERLHRLGVKIALDDFGVGYSSLSHLRMFPFDKLKIDRAFVTDCSADVQSATVVHAVISIGRALGMKVVAEGVETEEQRKFLKVAGVHAMQGYLFKRPETIGELRAELSSVASGGTGGLARSVG